MFSTRSIIIVLLVFALFASNTWWILHDQEIQNELATLRGLAHREAIQNRVLSFSTLFIDKVLNAKGEIGFDDRLQIENAVRDLEDPEILNRWNQFISSQNENEAQTHVKMLLSLLIHRLAGIR